MNAISRLSRLRTWAKSVPLTAAAVRAYHSSVARRRAKRDYLSTHLPALAGLDFDEVHLSNSGNHPSVHARRTERYLALTGASILCLGCRDGLETGRWIDCGAERVV